MDLIKRIRIMDVLDACEVSEELRAKVVRCRLHGSDDAHIMLIILRDRMGKMIVEGASEAIAEGITGSIFLDASTDDAYVSAVVRDGINAEIISINYEGSKPA